MVVRYDLKSSMKSTPFQIRHGAFFLVHRVCFKLPEPPVANNYVIIRVQSLIIYMTTAKR